MSMDLTNGDWQPVQEIVRLNFKALHDLVGAHGDALKSAEKAVASKVGKSELTAALSEKVSVTELTTTFEELSRIIDDKADARDTGALVERMAGRAEVQAALAQHGVVAHVEQHVAAGAKARVRVAHHLAEELRLPPAHRREAHVRLAAI